MKTMRNLGRFAFRVLSGCCLLAASAFPVHAQSLTFTTFAGTAGGAGSADGTGSDARFDYPWGVATDSSGNVYVADSDNRTIRKITPAGVVTTLAGLAGSPPGRVDGTRSAARFFQPRGLAIDSGGNVYVADANHTIRKITPAGEVTTVAGSPGVTGSADGTGSIARFNSPYGMAIDGAGTLYVADAGNCTIRKITPAGVVTTLAGLQGIFSSEDGTGSAARFSAPLGVAVDRSGKVYVADSGNDTIRQITPAGVVTTFAGLPRSQGSADGAGSAARFILPAGIATDSGGNVYVADTLNNTIRKITPAGVVTTLAGSAAANDNAVDGATSTARFFSPGGVAVDSGGNIYVGDTANDSIRQVTPAGVVTTLAGSPAHRGITDGTASAALFFGPWGMAIDKARNIYVADTEASTIRKISSAGVVTTLAGSPLLAGSADGAGSAARFRGPEGVATDNAGNVYVAGYDNTVRKVTAAGMVTTLAGASGLAGSDDGIGAAARFNNPEGLVTDDDGNVFVADTFNDTIRKITPAGVVTTLAGSPGLAGSEDGAGSAARFSTPAGLAIDGSRNVYVGEIGNRAVRKITPAGVVTTFLTTNSSVNGVATDGAGNVYAVIGRTVQRITPAGVVTALGGGSIYQEGTEDGTGSDARFHDPMGVAADDSGNVYVSERSKYKIRVGRPSLADAATMDVSTGAVGVGRQLSTSPQTATSWHWRIFRQPSGSTATLSSTSIRNPLFIADVADLYVFQLTASDGVRTSITTVSLTAISGAPRRHAVRSAP